MNWDQFKNNLQDFKSAIIEQWDWFIDEQLDVIEANQNYFAEPQKAYVIDSEEAEKRLADWQQQQRNKIR